MRFKPYPQVLYAPKVRLVVLVSHPFSTDIKIRLKEDFVERFSFLYGLKFELRLFIFPIGCRLLLVLLTAPWKSLLWGMIALTRRTARFFFQCARGSIYMYIKTKTGTQCSRRTVYTSVSVSPAEQSCKTATAARRIYEKDRGHSVEHSMTQNTFLRLAFFKFVIEIIWWARLWQILLSVDEKMEKLMISSNNSLQLFNSLWQGISFNSLKCTM